MHGYATRIITLFAAASVAVAGGVTAGERCGELRIFSTASVQAELHDCGCKKKPLGGFARRATLLQDHAGACASILVDAGNWAAGARDEDPGAKSAFVWDLMAEMGYEAVTPGDLELVLGMDALTALHAAHPDLAVVSANITDLAGNPVWPATTVIEKGGLRIGITGTTGGAPYAFQKSNGRLETEEFRFRDSNEALAEAVAGLRDRVDVVIALLHETSLDARRLVEAVPGIDVAVVGHRPPHRFTPERTGSTLILEGGAQGKHLSVLDLIVAPTGTIADYNGEMKPVNLNLREDPAVASKVAAWEKLGASRGEAPDAEVTARN